jgi:hypothetical protein
LEVLEEVKIRLTLGFGIREMLCAPILFPETMPLVLEALHVEFVVWNFL